MWSYKGFGINIISEIEFPELMESDISQSSEYDLKISIGHIPNNLEGIKYETARYSYAIAKKSFLFDVKRIARYLAQDGTHIIIEIIDPHADSRTIRLYILATVMAAILIQRKRIPLHASSFFAKEKLIMLSGNSGVGKSTLLSEFIKNDFRLFSDDINIIRSENDRILVSATYPMIKLWEESIDLLNHHFFSDRSFRIKQNMNKYGFFFHENFDFGEYPAAIFVVLKKSTESFFSCKKLYGTDAFMAITQQIYRPILIQCSTYRKLQFELISAMTKQTSVMEVSRPEKCKPKELMQFILEKI